MFVVVEFEVLFVLLVIFFWDEGIFLTDEMLVDGFGIFVGEEGV